MNTQETLSDSDSPFPAILSGSAQPLLDVPDSRDVQFAIARAELEAVNDALAALQNEMRNLLDATGVIAILVDMQMRILSFTPHVARVARLAHIDAGRPLGNVLSHLIGCDHLLVAVDSVLHAHAAGPVQVQATSGAWFEACIHPYLHLDGVVQGATISFSDISALKQTQQALADGEARYRALVDWSPEGINILRDGRFVYVNPAAIQIYGANSAQDLLGHPSRDRVHPEDLPMALLRMSQVTSERASAPLVDMRFLRLDGTAIDVQVQAKLIDFEGAPAIHVAWRDITWQKRAEVQRLQSHERLQMADQVIHLAFHDELTGLPNRRVLNDRLQQATLASQRSASYGALMFLDLDNFKILNDTYGHTAGDMLLIEVAQRLQSCVRATDTVARFGGDEFVVMLSQLNGERTASAEQATTLAEKIRAALAQPYQLKVQRDGAPESSIEHRCTTSIGVAIFISDGSDGSGRDDILKRADTAMYCAKQAGRNKVHLYDPAD